MNRELLPDLIMAVEQQLHAPETPYVKSAFDRLVELGIPSPEAMTQLALCLAAETDAMLRKKRPFDVSAYRKLLDSLPFPDEPQEDETGPS